MSVLNTKYPEIRKSFVLSVKIIIIIMILMFPIGRSLFSIKKTVEKKITLHTKMFI